MKFLISIFIFFLPQLIFAQQKTSAKFIILDARLNNDVDMTPWVLENGGYLVFYENSQGNLLMGNIVPKKNTQSYGRLYSSNKESIDETEKLYKVDIFNFKWSYQNDYDVKKGTASIQLSKIFKPNGIAFTLKMILENLDIYIYKGYMEGTIDFSKY